MKLIMGSRDIVTPQAEMVFTRAPTPRSPSPTEPCAICLEKVPPGGWSAEPIPICRSCWPLLAWFRGLYAGSGDADISGRLGPETRFIEDISTDSLDYIAFVMEAEEAFGITIPDRDAERLLTVGEFLRDIRRRLRAEVGKPVRRSDPTANLWDRELDG